jgi:nucleotide-binding universal stress UspA family protein
MFKKILVATDGSDMGSRAITISVEFAATVKASVVFAFVTFPYTVSSIHYPLPSGTLPTHAEHEKANLERAQHIFRVANVVAKKANVPFQTVTVEHAQPWRGLLQAAQAQGCDLICMASHGRSGLSALLLGSETQKVLTHATMPVLVVR